MLRELQVTKDKPANSMYKAGEEKIMTGAPVVKDETTKTFKFADEETAADLFFVDKERVPSGINCARGNMSDYDEDFTILKENEFGKLVAYYVGERFAVDQFVKDNLVSGVRVAANTDGKLVKAGSGVVSKYVFKEFYNDNGHELALIEVSDTAAANA